MKEAAKEAFDLFTGYLPSIDEIAELGGSLRVLSKVDRRLVRKGGGFVAKLEKWRDSIEDMRDSFGKYRRGENRELFVKAAEKTFELSKELVEELERLEKHGPKPVVRILKTSGKLFGPLLSVYRISKRIKRIDERLEAVEKIQERSGGNAATMKDHVKANYEQAVNRFRDNLAEVERLTQ
jgi:hypothetical protein